MQTAEMTPSAFGKMPTELVENWAQYLEATDLQSFRLACKQADAQTLHTVAQRFFTSWRTSLMGSDLQKLEEISNNAELAKYVKEIRIEDDCEKNDAKLFLLEGTEREQEEKKMKMESNIWPRNEAGIVQTGDIGVASLKTMLIEKRLRPDTLTIYDYRAGNRTTSTEPVATLARDIIFDANLAITAVHIHGVSQSAAEATFQFNPEHQGKDVGFSMLKEAELRAAPDASQYWLKQIFYHAPILSDLKLSFDKPRNVQDWETAQGTPLFKLQKFHLSMSTVPASLIRAILANSKHSLTAITLSTMTLQQAPGSNWKELLSSIGNEFPALSSFELKFLSEEGSGPIKFEGLSKEKLDESCRDGLEIVPRGPKDNRRITWVKYKGSGAGGVLKTVASYARV